jgi:DNA-directed RNA polymerase specialized sigma24 family protein
MYRIALNVAISHQRRERPRARCVIADDERLLETPDDREGAPAELGALCR